MKWYSEMVPWPPHGFTPLGIELKAERRVPSGENHGEIKNIPTTNAFGLKNNGRQRNPQAFASIQMPLSKIHVIRTDIAHITHLVNRTPRRMKNR
jgi:hypothetical protein